jgi:hypothetical protein
LVRRDLSRWKQKRRQAAAEKSGDRSPHSKELSHRLDNYAFSRVKSRASLMNETLNKASETAPVQRANNNIEVRIFRTMMVASGVAVSVSAIFAPWRVTTGLLLGGVLALLNHYWLRSSAAAAFSVLAHGAKPKLTLINYVLRYLVVSLVVFVAYQLNVISLAATILGLCSFVVALFVEAVREFYFAIIHREEIS